MKRQTQKWILQYSTPIIMLLTMAAAVMADALVGTGRPAAPRQEEPPIQTQPEENPAQKREPGFYRDERGTHLCCEDGRDYIGWLETTAGYMYFDENGIQLRNCLKVIEGGTYFFDADGIARFGEVETPEGWMLLNEDGSLGSGFIGENGVGHYYREDGKRAVGTVIGKYVIDENGTAVNRFPLITPENLEEYCEYLLDEHGRSAREIFEFVRWEFVYVFREEAAEDEMIIRMLNTGAGSCYDYASLTARLLSSAGYECIKIRGKGTFHPEHEWVLLRQEDGSWRHMDPIWGSLEVYGLTDEELLAISADPTNDCTYDWDRSAYPAAE